MATANGTWLSVPDATDNGFWSNFGQILQGVGQVITPIFAQNPPKPTPAAPTYQGQNTGTTGGGIAGTSAIAQYMPLILIGGGLLVLTLAFKK